MGLEGGSVGLERGITVTLEEGSYSFAGFHIAMVSSGVLWFVLCVLMICGLGSDLSKDRLICESTKLITFDH